MVDLMVSQNRTTNAAASYYRSYARHALWSTLFQNMILPSIRGVERARIDIMLIPIVNDVQIHHLGPQNGIPGGQQAMLPVLCLKAAQKKVSQTRSSDI